MNMPRRIGAEFLAPFWLTFAGCGAEQRGPAQPQVVLAKGLQLFDLSDDFGFCGLAHD